MRFRMRKMIHDIDSLIPPEPSEQSRAQMQRLEAHLEVLFAEFAKNRGRVSDRDLAREIVGDMTELQQICDAEYPAAANADDVYGWRSFMGAVTRAFDAYDSFGGRRRALTEALDEAERELETSSARTGEGKAAHSLSVGR